MSYRHRLPKLVLLQYAWEGACTQRGLCEDPHAKDDEEYLEMLNADIKEIERRIKLVESAEARKGAES